MHLIYIILFILMDFTVFRSKFLIFIQIFLEYLWYIFFYNNYLQ